MYIYQVADDRQGMNTILAVYDNEKAAEDHRAHLAATDDVYGDYFLVHQHKLNHAADKDLKSVFDPNDDD